MTTDTHRTTRNASHRDALGGVVDDHLLTNTQRYERSKKRATGARRCTMRKTGTYWDKKTGVLRATARPKRTL